MTTTHAREVRMLGEVQHRDEAEARLERPGDALIVRRGVLRSLVMRCPDGCGETLAINLDPRMAKAWRFYERRGQATLFPSVWRDSGCESHFIVWRGKILWCGLPGNIEPPYDAELEASVVSALSKTPQSDCELAERIDEIPYDVDRVLRKLASTGRARPIGTRPVRYTVPDPIEQRIGDDPRTGEPVQHKKRRWWHRILGRLTK